MVVKGKEKLICDLAKDYCAYYDLGTDPREEHNLAETRPERVAALHQLLDTWLDEQARFESKRLVGADTPVLSQAIERGRMGDADAASELAALLQSQAPVELRREAARLLVEALPARPDTRPMLVAAMNAADDDEVRDWAAVAAMRLGEAAGRARLLAVVGRSGSEANAALRRHAALSLGQAGDGAGVVVLGEALDACAGKEALCKTIIAVLGKLHDVRAVPALMAHLPDVLTRLEVVQALGEIGDASAEPALVERLKSDEYVPVRVAATLWPAWAARVRCSRSNGQPAMTTNRAWPRPLAPDWQNCGGHRSAGRGFSQETRQPRAGFGISSRERAVGPHASWGRLATGRRTFHLRRQP